MGGFEALLRACRVWLGTERGPLGFGPEVDLRDLEQRAYVHNLEPLLHHLVAAGDLRPIPPPLAVRWEEAYFTNRLFNIEALDILGRLVAGCEQQGVATAVLKGPVTVARGYRDPGLRIMLDLDLACREQDLAAICRVVAGEGFDRGTENAVYHVSFGHRELELLVEVHFDLYDFLPRHGELLAELLRAAEFVELEGVRFPALPAAAALLFDVAHLVEHDFRVNLRPLLDLAACVRTAGPELDGEVVAAEARRFDLEPELGLAAALVERLFGVALPGRGGAGVDDGEVERITAGLETVAAGGAVALAGVGRRPGAGSKLRYLRRLLFPPRAHLEALGHGRRQHLAAAVGRGLRKLRTGGLVRRAREEPSVKRRVYERRRASR